MIYILLGLLVVVVIVFFVLLKSHSKKTSDEIVMQNDALNQSDINMMQKLNAGGFSSSTTKSKEIVVPDFKVGEKLGYKDLSNENKSNINK